MTRSLVAVLAACLLVPACQDDPRPEAEPGTKVPEPPAAAAPTATAPAATVGAVLTFDTLEHDLGPISDAGAQLISFAFTNTGDEPLVISAVKPSCGCTTVTLEETEYAPGAGAAIEVEYTPDGTGPQRKTIDVLSNDHRHAGVQLALAADVTPFVLFDPPFLKFDGVALGQEHQAFLSVTSHDPGMTIESIAVRGRARGYLSARVIDDGTVPAPGGEVEEPGVGRRHVVLVTLGEDAPWGTALDTISIVCRGRPDPGGATIDHRTGIVVQSVVHGELRADASEILLGRLAPGSSFRRTIRLIRRSGEPFAITGVEVTRSSLPGLTAGATPMPREEGSGYEVTLQGEIGDHRGAVSGIVTITTDVAGEERLLVPFRGVAGAGSG